MHVLNFQIIRDQIETYFFKMKFLILRNRLVFSCYPLIHLYLSNMAKLLLYPFYYTANPMAASIYYWLYLFGHRISTSLDCFLH